MWYTDVNVQVHIAIPYKRTVQTTLNSYLVYSTKKNYHMCSLITIRVIWRTYNNSQ